MPKPTDPTQFYYELSLRLTIKGQRIMRVKPTYAAFWFRSQVQPNRAWIVVWSRTTRSNGDLSAFPMLVDLALLRVADSPTDLPPLPEWAGSNTDHVPAAWREWQASQTPKKLTRFLPPPPKLRVPVTYLESLIYG